MDELIQEIKKSFNKVGFPGNENLVNSSYGEESEMIRKHFLGQNEWEILTSEFLDQDGALSFFSNEAFRFYIPAYMIADIKGELGLNDPSVRLCWSLTTQSENQKIAKVWGGGTMGERAKECFRHFSTDQVNTIISYLKFKLTQNNDLCIQEALENYWLKIMNNINS